LDLASEEVACSSGVLLTDSNIKGLSVRYDIDEFRYLERSDRETVMRPEDFEDAVLSIRKAIGSLPDTKMGRFFVVDAIIALNNEGGDAANERMRRHEQSCPVCNHKRRNPHLLN
jgi:hypothetical protein